MARIGDEFLDEDAIVAETRLRLGTGAGKAFGDLVAAVRNAHALAAAAGRRLDHDRVADLIGDLGRLRFVFDHAEMAGHGRDLGGSRGLFALDLVAHRGDGFGVRPDEDNAGIRKRGGERRALGEEAVARMHRLGARRFARGDDLLDDEIALRRRRRTDQHRLVGHLDMERVAIGLGIDRHRGNAHAARGLDNPAGDLAAIGNQDSLEHTDGKSREPALCLCCAAAKKSMTATVRQWSVNVDVSLLDDHAIGRGLALDPGVEFGRTRRNGRDAAAGEPLLHVGHIEDFDQFGVELVEDRLRRRFGRQKRGPVRRIDVAGALFLSASANPD